MLILFFVFLGVEAPGEERFLIAILMMMIGLYYFNEKDQKAKAPETISGHHAHSTH